MKKNKNAVWMTMLLSVVLLAVFVIGYVYRTGLMDIEINKYEGHVLTTPQKKASSEKKGQTIPGLSFALLNNPDDTLFAKGKKLYDLTCAACHGAEGKGDGPAAIAFNPGPRNFHEPEGWKNGAKLSGIYKTLTEGIEGTGMTAFEYLVPEKRLAMAHYIRSFNADLPKDNDTELKAFDDQFALTKGTVLPNTITLEKAEGLLLEENSALNDKVARSLAFIQKDSSPEKQVFLRYVKDLDKAIVLLNKSDIGARKYVDFLRLIDSGAYDPGFHLSAAGSNNSELKIVYDYSKRLYQL